MTQIQNTGTFHPALVAVLRRAAEQSGFRLIPTRFLALGDEARSQAVTPVTIRDAFIELAKVKYQQWGKRAGIQTRDVVNGIAVALFNRTIREAGNMIDQASKQAQNGYVPVSLIESMPTFCLPELVATITAVLNCDGVFVSRDKCRELKKALELYQGLMGHRADFDALFRRLERIAPEAKEQTTMVPERNGGLSGLGHLAADHGVDHTDNR